MYRYQERKWWERWLIQLKIWPAKGKTIQIRKESNKFANQLGPHDIRALKDKTIEANKKQKKKKKKQKHKDEINLKSLGTNPLYGWYAQNIRNTNIDKVKTNSWIKRDGLKRDRGVNNISTGPEPTN